MSILKKIIKNKHLSRLREGDQAPDFKGNDQDGKLISLQDYKGKKVLLYFYPKDDTPGCTAQSCNLRDHYDILLKKGFVVLGVSADDEKSHQKFIAKYHLPFPLIADTDKKIINDYDVWGEKTIFGKKMNGIIRTTFVIAESGRIERIVTDVDTANHTQQIINEYSQ